ncbi:MAG: hypothetical protein RL081_2228 [Pseudomonadota bacterium]
MKAHAPLPLWSLIAPIAGWMLLALSLLGLQGGLWLVLMTAALIAGVLSAVHHVIEVALIVSLMLTGGPQTTALARDTVFAAVMLILNGIVGLCLLVGGSRYREQTFGLLGVSASLATLAAIAILTLVLPNYTTSVPGPVYSPSQLAFVAVVSLVLYGTFVLVQTVRHRDYFLPLDAHEDHEAHAQPPSNRLAAASAALLLLSLGAVVLLAKSLAPAIELAVASAGAPKAVVGIIIAMVVLLPEGLALALGSALASIGLTIPAVAMVSLATGWTLTLGLDIKSTVLLLLSLFISTLSLGTGRTTVLQGVVHLVVLATYLFTTIVP